MILLLPQNNYLKQKSSVCRPTGEISQDMSSQNLANCDNVCHPLVEMSSHTSATWDRVSSRNLPLTYARCLKVTRDLL